MNVMRQGQDNQTLQLVALAVVIFTILCLALAWLIGENVVTAFYQDRWADAIPAISPKWDNYPLDSYILGYYRNLFRLLTFGVLLILPLLAFSIDIDQLLNRLVRGNAITIALYALCIVLGFLLATNGVFWFRGIAAATAYPFELEYAEGPIFSQIQRLRSGLSVYMPLSAASLTVTNYPLAYHYVVSFVSSFGFDILQAGRLVSSFSAFIIALLVACITFFSTRDKAGIEIRAGSAIAAALFFLASDYTWRWGPLLRIDMMAVMLSVAGVAAFVLSKTDRQRLLLSAPLFVLAIYTKQSTIAGLSACFVFAAIIRPKLAIQLFAVVTLLGFMILALALYTTDGNFFNHIFRYNINRFEIERTLSFVFRVFWGKEKFVGYGVILLVAAIASWHFGKSYFVSAWSRRKDISSAALFADVSALRALLALYVVSSFLVSLTIGKLGSSFNYFIELIAAACTMFGIAGAVLFSETQARLQERSRKLSGALVPLTTILVSANLLMLHDFLYSFGEYEAVGRDRENVNAVLEEIKAADGEVLSEDMTLVTLSGKAIIYQPFMATQLSYQGLLDVDPVVKIISQKEFPLIVLMQNAEEMSGQDRDRFPARMLKAISEHYVLSRRLRNGRTDGRPYYFIYRPSRARPAT